MHPAETALRAAVAAAPDAALPRLVYADFLDDHDHPHHAAALRLDVAMAAERPWADRYWLLRADRDAHTPANFPGDLGWLSDRQPLLCGVPDDWKSRWRAVRAFVSRWWPVSLLGDVGYWRAAVEEAERAAGRELPPGVKEWASFSEEMDITNSEALRDPLGFFGRLGDAVTLHERAEGDAFWVVPDDRLNDPDPPVFLTGADGAPYFGDGRSGYADTTAGFALFYLISHRAEQSDAPDSDARRAAFAPFPHAGRFDRAEVGEAPGRAVVILPAGTWGFHAAQLFTLTAQAGPAGGVPCFRC